MPVQPPTPDDRQARLSQVLTEYLEAAESGTELDQTTLLAANPELAAELVDFLSAVEQVDRYPPLNLSRSGDMFVGPGCISQNEKSMDVSVPEIRVMIPSELRALCGISARSRKAELSLMARDVRGLLAELARQHPQVHVRLCDERGDPRPHINVFVNNDHVRARAALDTPLAAGDVVTILPAVSGG